MFTNNLMWLHWILCTSISAKSRICVNKKEEKCHSVVSNPNIQDEWMDTFTCSIGMPTILYWDVHVHYDEEQYEAPMWVMWFTYCERHMFSKPNCDILYWLHPHIWTWLDANECLFLFIHSDHVRRDGCFYVKWANMQIKLIFEIRNACEYKRR